MAFTSEQEDALWELWGKGEPSRLIARSLRSNPSAVRAHLAKHGGVRPVPRRRSRQHLTADQREELTRGIAGDVVSMLGYGIPDRLQHLDRRRVGVRRDEQQHVVALFEDQALLRSASLWRWWMIQVVSQALPR